MDNTDKTYSMSDCVYSGFKRVGHFFLYTVFISSLPLLFCAFLCYVYGIKELQLLLETLTLVLGVFITSLTDFVSNDLWLEKNCKSIFVLMVILLAFYCLSYAAIYIEAFKETEISGTTLSHLEFIMIILSIAYLILAVSMQWIGGYKGVGR